jgi:tetratricopeptide (TPR) repeat protein
MKKMKFYFIIATVLNFASFSVWADNAKSTLPLQFQQAMQNKNWDFANVSIDSMLQEAPYQDQLWYNKGVVYYQQHLLAESIACFQKAILLNPFNKDAKDNLLVAQSRLVDRFPNYFDFILLRWWKLLSSPYFHTYWAFTALGLWVLIGLCMYLPKALQTKKQFRIVKNSLLFLSICFFIMAYFSWSSLKNTTVFVVQSDQAMQYATPIAKSGTKVPYGTIVSVLERTPNWYKVALPNGVETWMQQQTLTKF